MPNLQFILQWHITAMCDQHCKHCYMYDEPTYESEAKHPLTLEQAKLVVDDFHEMVSKIGIRGSIHFTGGDPLLRPDFLKILEYVKGKGDLEVSIMGNPYHVNYEMAVKLKKHGVHAYQISLDGLENTHDRLRRPGSFKESLRALRDLDLAGIVTVVMFTLSKENKDDLIPLIEFVDKERIDVFDFARVSPVGTGKNLKKSTLDPQEYRELLFDILEKYRQLKLNGSKTHFGRKDHLWQLLYDEMGLLSPPSTDKKSIISGCGVGINIVAILADGTVYACRRFPSPIGKVPEQKLWDIFIKSPQLNKYRQYEKMKKCGKCELLQTCRGCPAVAYGSNGSYFAPDPQCWKEDKDGAV